MGRSSRRNSQHNFFHVSETHIHHSPTYILLGPPEKRRKRLAVLIALVTGLVGFGANVSQITGRTTEHLADWVRALGHSTPSEAPAGQTPQSYTPPTTTASSNPQPIDLTTPECVADPEADGIAAQSIGVVEEYVAAVLQCDRPKWESFRDPMFKANPDRDWLDQWTHHRKLWAEPFIPQDAPKRRLPVNRRIIWYVVPLESTDEKGVTTYGYDYWAVDEDTETIVAGAAGKWDCPGAVHACLPPEHGDI